MATSKIKKVPGFTKIHKVCGLTTLYNVSKSLQVIVMGVPTVMPKCEFKHI